MTRLNIIFSILILVFLSLSANLSADEVLNKRSEAKRLIATLIPFSIKGGYSLQDFQKDYQKYLQDVPEEVWVDIVKGINIKIPEDILVEMIVSDFTDDELKEILAFYESQAGQKFQNYLPDLYSKFTNYQIKNSQEVLGQIIDVLKKQGYKTDKFESLLHDFENPHSFLKTLYKIQHPTHNYTMNKSRIWCYKATKEARFCDIWI